MWKMINSPLGHIPQWVEEKPPEPLNVEGGGNEQRFIHFRGEGGGINVVEVSRDKLSIELPRGHDTWCDELLREEVMRLIPHLLAWIRTGTLALLPENQTVGETTEPVQVVDKPEKGYITSAELESKGIDTRMNKDEPRKEVFYYIVKLSPHVNSDDLEVLTEEELKTVLEVVGGKVYYEGCEVIRDVPNIYMANEYCYIFRGEPWVPTVRTTTKTIEVSEIDLT